MSHMSLHMINLNKQLMVRKMSDDEKTEEEKLIELQNYFNRIRKSRTKRTLEQPLTDYGYLNLYLADNIDSYVLQFENEDSQMIGQYAQGLKDKLREQKIVAVKEVPYNQFNVSNPQKIIVFQDGSEETVPMTLIKEADAQEQQKIDFINENTDKVLSEASLNQKNTDEQIGGSSASKIIEEDKPLEETVVDGIYTYFYKDGVPYRIQDQEGTLYPLNEKSRKVMEQKLDEKRRKIPPEPILQNEEIIPKEQTLEPTTTIKEVEEKIKEKDPKDMKQLGEKAKKGFKNFSAEQKAMGLLLGLEVGSEALNYMGPARREARDRIAELEERRAKGQLGVDQKQDAETMKYMTRPIRAMAEESEREQQAVMAGMGETRSAADLRRLRDSRDAQMTDALSRAGQEVARQQMARKEMERRELNELQAYQQENLRNLTNRITGSVAQMAGTFGANKAAEAQLQDELSPEKIQRYMTILKEQNPNLSNDELKRMATDFGIERAKTRLLFAGY